MNYSKITSCKECQDLILKEKCFVCNKMVDICKKCKETRIRDYFIFSFFDKLNLEWISILKGNQISLCDRCIQTGLYLNQEIDLKWTIPYRIYCLIKRKR